MASTKYIACTRMYNACGHVTGLWDRFIQTAAALSDVTLCIERHPFPRDIEELWNSPNLGLVFICGRAFALGGMRHIPVAVPVREGGSSFYSSHILVRSDAPYERCGDLSNVKIGWTVPHSHSGYLAILRYFSSLGMDAKALFAHGTGPLHTPANCLNALREKEADAVPLDGYYYDLLRRNAPETLAGTRILATTREYPMPFLAASEDLPEETKKALRQGVLEAAALPATAPVLAGLCLTGFTLPDPAAYAALGAPEEGV